ncbi:ATPase AAA domain-containing protein 5, partial [Physocladia obscura]
LESSIDTKNQSLSNLVPAETSNFHRLFKKRYFNEKIASLVVKNPDSIDDCEPEDPSNYRRKSKRLAKVPPKFYPNQIFDFDDEAKKEKAKSNDDYVTTPVKKKKLAGNPKPLKQHEQTESRILTDKELLKANTFFLSAEQRRLQKMLQGQQQLMKEIEESQRISAEFSKGKILNPFLQPRLFVPPETKNSEKCRAIQGNTLPTGWKDCPIEAPLPNSLNCNVGWSQSGTFEFGEIETPFKLKGKLEKVAHTIVMPVILTVKDCVKESKNIEVDKIISPMKDLEDWNVFYDMADIIKLGSRMPMIEISSDVVYSYLVKIHGFDRVSSNQNLWNAVLHANKEAIAKSKESWIEKFKPSSTADLIGDHNSKQVMQLKTWLLDWKTAKSQDTKSMESATKKLKFKKPKRLQDDFIVDDDEEESYHVSENEAEDFIDDSNSDDDIFQPVSGKRIRKLKKRIRKKVNGEFVKPNIHLRLIGPPSSGRTSSIRAVASECGFEIIEINSGHKRSGKEVASLLSEATQSHAVTLDSGGSFSASSATANDNDSKNTFEKSKPAKGNLFALFGAKARKKESTSNNTHSNRKNVIDDSDSDSSSQSIENKPSTSSATHSLIVVEDADILFDQDKGFWNAMWSIMEFSKRPIVFTCSGLCIDFLFFIIFAQLKHEYLEDPINSQNVHIPSNLLTNLQNSTESLFFKSPSLSDVFCYLHLLVLGEGFWIDHQDLRNMCDESKSDIRKCLAQTEIYTKFFDENASAASPLLISVGANSRNFAVNQNSRKLKFQVRNLNQRHHTCAQTNGIGLCFSCVDWTGVGENESSVVGDSGQKLPEIQTMETIAAISDRAIICDHLTKFSALEGFDSITYFGSDISIDEIPSPFPALINKYQTATGGSYSLAQDIAENFSEISKNLAKQVFPSLSLDYQCLTDILPQIPKIPDGLILAPHNFPKSRQLRMEYLPYLSIACSYDTLNEREKRLIQEKDDENSEIIFSGFGETAGAALALDFKKKMEGGLRRSARRSKFVPVRHFKDILTEDEADTLIRQMSQ